MNDGWRVFNSHCYKFIQTKKTWSGAKTYCVGQGGYSVTVHSQAENDFVVNLVNSNVWMGGSDIASEGTWIWEDGKAWASYQNFASGEPNNGAAGGEDCLEMVKGNDNNGRWNDISCGYAKSSVCKK